MYSSNESDLQKSQPPQNHYNYHSTEAIAPANIPGTWSTGLYDCSSDVPNCKLIDQFTSYSMLASYNSLEFIILGFFFFFKLFGNVPLNSEIEIEGLKN